MLHFDRPELRAPQGGWTAPDPARRRWISKAVDAVQAALDLLPQPSLHCDGTPMHAICIGFDPMTKRPCSCTCHDKD